MKIKRVVKIVNISSNFFARNKKRTKKKAPNQKPKQKIVVPNSIAQSPKRKPEHPIPFGVAKLQLITRAPNSFGVLEQLTKELKKKNREILLLHDVYPPAFFFSLRLRVLLLNLVPAPPATSKPNSVRPNHKLFVEALQPVTAYNLMEDRKEVSLFYISVCAFILPVRVFFVVLLFGG